METQTKQPFVRLRTKWISLCHPSEHHDPTTSLFSKMSSGWLVIFLIETVPVVFLTQWITTDTHTACWRWFIRPNQHTCTMDCNNSRQWLFLLSFPVVGGVCAGITLCVLLCLWTAEVKRWVNRTLAFAAAAVGSDAKLWAMCSGGAVCTAAAGLFQITNELSSQPVCVSNEA